MSRLHGGLRVLTAAEMYQIHRTVLQIIDDPGPSIRGLDTALEALRRAGLRVNRVHGRVHLPEQEVLRTIRTLCGADSEHIGETGTDCPVQPLRLPAAVRGRVGAMQTEVWDLGVGGPRPATHQDVIALIKLRRRLRGVLDDSIGILPADVPAPVAHVHAAAMAARYLTRPRIVRCGGSEDALWVARIMQTAGVWPKGKAANGPVAATPPLTLTGRDGELLIARNASGGLTWVGSSIEMGTTAPRTVAAATALAFSEILALNTISRLLCPEPRPDFRPRHVGCDNVVGPGPQAAQLRIAMRQMAAAFYKFPGGTACAIGGPTRSPYPGLHASMDTALGAATELLAGCYSYEHPVVAVQSAMGILAGGRYLSLEQAAIDHTALSWLQGLLERAPVDDEGLALSTIREVGAGGSFWDAESAAGWSWDEAADPLRAAREVVRDAQGDELRPVLDDDRLDEIDRLVQAGERELLGATTGVLA